MADARETVPLDAAWARLDAALAGEAPAAEIVPVRAARGRWLRADQASRLELPPFDKSAMDGYALLPGDEREEYRLLETVAAGQTPSARLLPGTTVKVMTGAPVPEGTGKVVMREDTEEVGEIVRVVRHDDRPNLCRRGEDVRVGDVLLRAGRRLGPVDVANLISCGVTEVPVAPRVKVAVLSTGDEIAADPADLRPGMIMDSNGPMLSGLAAAHGLEIVRERAVRDDLGETIAALEDALDAADLVVLSGGVSVGDFDYVLTAFERIGLKVHFSLIAVKPGRPTVFASRGRRAVLGLPGNPVSVFLMFHLFVLRAAARLGGVAPVLREFRMTLASGFRRRKTDRLEFVPVRLTEAAGVAPVEFHGSAHLAALAKADGFFAVPVGVAEVPAGQLVRFVPFAEGGA